MRTDVVIAGCGVVTPFGRGRQALADAVFAGHSALRPAEDTSLGAEDSWVGCLDQSEGQGIERPLLAAVEEALADLRVPAAADARWAVVMPTFATSESMLPAPAEWPPDPMPVIGRRIPARSHEYRVTAACSSTSVAVTLARMLLAQDLADVALVAGAIRHNVYDHLSLAVTGTLAADAARPFDASRSGMSLGEGAGAIVLVRADDHASVSAGGGPYARISGAASLCRARRPRSVDVEIPTAEECIRRALPGPDGPAIDLVFAHAVGTVQGDRAEYDAITAVLGSDVPISSHKGATGHLLNCSGFVAIALACESLARRHIPPCVGLRTPDPELGGHRLPLETRRHPIGTVLINNFGFAGNYASLTLAAS